MVRGEGGEGGWGERSGGRRVSTGRGRGNSLLAAMMALLPRLPPKASYCFIELYN